MNAYFTRGGMMLHSVQLMIDHGLSQPVHVVDMEGTWCVIHGKGCANQGWPCRCGALLVQTQNGQARLVYSPVGP